MPRLWATPTESKNRGKGILMSIRKIIQTLLVMGRLVRMFIEVAPINRC
jgi:hypothetical protein